MKIILEVSVAVCVNGEREDGVRVLSRTAEDGIFRDKQRFLCNLGGIVVSMFSL